MSLLNDLLGAAAPAGAPAGAGHPMMDLVGNLIQQSGGINGLVAILGRSGLGEHVQSWISTGANLPVSADQLQAALGSGQAGALLAQAAQRMGMSQEDLMAKVAQVLPHAVDHLTPDGQVGAPGSFDLGALAGLAGRLFATARG
jgi:uncharacterized protein YidB (DUF937 family)